MNWLDYFSNAQVNQIKKVMFDLLQERYSPNEQIIERLGSSLSTEKDVKEFFKLVTDIYEGAYLKAVKDHREQLEKMGLVANIKSAR